ncbi:response regulator transcription factor [Occallatibacter savannae]|uniref:response regulator transcription factor n=1 Tax=Occallatibacter savannae TaxID=1002691 RepID=UPI001EF59ED1|nr:response regulator transcription factor [Occallatibacter savannae]
MPPSIAPAYLCTMEALNLLSGSDKPTVIRVILADSQAIYTEGLSRIIALEKDVRLVAQVNCLDQLRIAVEHNPCDVVLVEGELLITGASVVAELLRIAPEAKFIVQCEAANERQTVELFRRGIRGIVSRSISPDLLLRCVRRIAAGETWIDNQALNWMLEAYRLLEAALVDPRTQMHLSPREKAIISGVTRGMRNKEIAYEIGTSEQVIKNYLRKIYDKLGVNDRIELALFCLHDKLISQEIDQVAATGPSTNWIARA